MNLEIDFRSGIPIYVQIVERIKEMIASGRIEPGDQLPTVRTLAQELRVNFNTIARAYRILDEVGIISTQQGRGTYIMEMPPPEVSESIRRKALEALIHRFLTDAERLNASPEELIEILKDQVARWQEIGHLSDPEPEPQ
jgi:GntR family transcriptional regulator